MSFQQNQSRRFLPPGGYRKRKERDESEAKKAAAPPFNGFKPPAPKPPKPPKSPMSATQQTTPSPMSSNRLLAGYMAYEYLTKGSMLGQKIDQGVLMKNAEARRGKKAAEDGKDAAAGAEEERYATVAGILKTEEAHIPGIVNPTQLGKWIENQM